ncbi:gp58-like family protein [Heyndrickxia coagulans]|uniref:gp58-like family protein n=1 Tax=Heyndrickxia coagulans TaxID=1398 RepID=UPI003D1C7168
MTLLGSVDIPFTKSTKIAVDATDTAGQAATVAQQATDTAGQAQATAQTASQTATQAAATAADAAQAAQTAITTANGKNKAYYGATTPTSPQPGDIWFVEDGNNNVTAIKHYDGTQWITDVDNTALEQQISAAQAAADNAATVGQAAQQTAADAEARGDAAAKEAGEAKDAATKAQADAASAVTSANNAVSTANQATQVAQDAIDKAQDGFGVAQDALSKAGAAETNSQSALNTANTAAKDAQSALTAASNATDTANTAKQVASDAATAASTAKTNAQTAMSNAQEAINKANAANANANTREKSIIKSNAAPSNPATDQLWIDTSKTPQIMRRWNGSAWVDLSPTQASQIGAVSTTTYTTDITNINNTLSQKASVETVNTLSGRVDKAETSISQNANDIALKADKTVVDTLKNTVDNHSTLISQNANAIQLKADKSTVDTLTGRVSTAEATLTTQANQIAARITKTDADAKYATQTALTATANSLTSSISAVQTNLDNLQVGGTNLIKNSDFSSGMDSWSPHLGTNGTSSILTNKFQGHNAIHVSVTSGYSDIIQIIDNIESSTDYTFSGNLGGAVKIFFVELKSDGNNTAVYSDNYHYYPSQNFEGLTPRVSFTFRTQPDTAKLRMYFRVEKKNEDPATYGRGTLLKLEKGNKATDWSPAPEDMATVAQFNTLSQTLDSTTSRIGNAEGNISALQQTANSFATRISNAEGNISTLTQTAQGLQTAVSGKVDATTYNSFVTQTNSALQSKLSATDAANTYATQNQLTQTASSLTSKITSVQTNLDNLQIGGRNLVRNGDFSLGLHAGSTTAPYNWFFWGDTYVWGRQGSDSYNQPGTIYIAHSSLDGGIYQKLNLKPNTKYTIGFESTYEYSLSNVSNHMEFYDSNNNLITQIDFKYDYSKGGRQYFTFTTISNYAFAQFVQNAHNSTKADNGFLSTLSYVSLVEGEHGADWTPAPEDLATQSQISQLSDDINLRVSKNDVINQINVSTEGILIDGKKVHITGQTTIDNAVIKDAMIDSMTANKLTAGTIDANVITVKNINASNIVTGTLDASKATVTNIDASKITTGTLNAARIAAGSIDASKLAAGTITAASGVIGSLDASKITTGTLDAAKVSVVNLSADNIVSGTLKAIKIEGAYGTFTGTVEGATIKSSDRPSFSDPNFTNRAMLSNGTLIIESRNDDVGAYGQVKIDGGRLQASGVPGIFTMPDPYKPPKDNFTNYGSGYIYSANNLFINAEKVAFGSANESNLNIDAWDGKINLKGGSIYAGFYDDLVIKSGSSRICFGDDRILSNTPLSILAYSDHGRIEGITGVSMNTLDSNNFSNFYASVLGEFRVTDVSSNSTYKPVRASSFPTGSLAEFKTEITKWEASALDIINSADIYQYRLKDDVKSGKDKVRHGLVIGEGYRTPAEVIDGDGVEQYEMNSLSWKAIQELSASDSSNKERLSILEEQNNNLLLKVASLELELADIKQKLGVA